MEAIAAEFASVIALPAAVGVQVNVLSCVRQNMSSRSYPLGLRPTTHQSTLIIHWRRTSGLGEAGPGLPSVEVCAQGLD